MNENAFEIKDGILRKYNGEDKSPSLPCGITKIGAGAFKRKDITSITLPNGLKYIGDDAFEGCHSLKRINLPDGLIEIGFQAFKGCECLEEVLLPDSLKLIGTYAFMDCKEIKEIAIPGTDIYISEDALRGSGIKEAIIKEGKMSVPDRCFYGCMELESISLPESIRSIGNGAFAGCTALKDIFLPSKLGSIGESAFYNCKAITHIELPESLSQIGSLAFIGCSITELTVPCQVKALTKCPFGTSIKKIILPDSICDIDLDAFTGCRELEDIIFSKADEFMYCFLETPFSKKRENISDATK